MALDENRTICLIMFTLRETAYNERDTDPRKRTSLSKHWLGILPL